MKEQIRQLAIMVARLADEHPGCDRVFAIQKDALALAESLATQEDHLLAAFKRVHTALHRLWTKNVGTSNYAKDEWRELDNAISNLGSFAAKSIGYDGPLLPPVWKENG